MEEGMLSGRAKKNTKNQGKHSSGYSRRTDRMQRQNGSASLRAHRSPLLASGISQNATINKQTHQERETGHCARVIHALPSKATAPTRRARSSTGLGGGWEYWRRRLSNPTNIVAHAHSTGFPSRPLLPVIYPRPPPRHLFFSSP